MYESWNRYVYHIFCIVKVNYLDNSLKLLNIQDKNIDFTMEIENNNYLALLDLKIMKNNKKLEFGIFWKDTHTVGGYWKMKIMTLYISTANSHL